MPVCKSCARHWTAINAAHCPNCCETFASIKGFDQHRQNGVCAIPRQIGLDLSAELYWRVPGEPEPVAEPPKRRGRPKGSKNKPKASSIAN